MTVRHCGDVFHRPGWSAGVCLRSAKALGPYLTLLAAFFLLGCGHPASESECREILRTAAQLELKARLDDSKHLIEQETAALEASMKGTMMDKCVGKRITDKALQCVRSARTSEELFDECFR